MDKQVSQFTVDTSITTVSRVFQLVLALVSSMIIARVLGPDGRGIYVMAIFLPMLLPSLSGLGVAQAAVFQLGKGTYSQRDVLGNNLALSLIFGAFGSLLGLIVLLCWGDVLFPEVAKKYLLLALMIVPMNFFLTFMGNFFVGVQRISLYNFVNSLKACVFLVLIITLLLKLKTGVSAAITAQILSYFIMAIVVLFLARRVAGGLSLCLQKSYVKGAFTYGFKVYLGNVMGLLHYRIDVFLVNLLLNPVAVGLYSVSVVVAQKIWLISASASVVLFPKVCSEKDEKNLSEFTPFVFRTVLLITVVGSAVLWFLGRWLIVLCFSEKFAASVAPFQILLVGVVAMSGWRILANDLNGRGRSEMNIYINATSVAMNIVLNIIMIPKLGIVGVAWATSISYTFALVAVTVVYMRISQNSIRAVLLPHEFDFSLYRGVLRRTP